MSCFICATEKLLTKCEDCEVINYCREHGDHHQFQGKCLPFKVKRSMARGSHVVTLRDVSEGELILVDYPMLISPHTKSKPQCLQCARLVSGSYKCSKCNFPMCDEICEAGDLHSRECSIFQSVDFEADVEFDGKVDDHYASILPLRCIHLSQTDQKKWKTYKSFLSHSEERKKSNPDLWHYHSEHSVDFVRDICEMEETWSEDDIHEILGIMMVNSLDISKGAGYGELMGFYPVFSNINHSCISNSKVIKDKTSLKVEVRAKRDIKAGEEICFQYLIETQPTRVRRQLLNRKWFFLCDCIRCLDSTECGTYLDALICAQCEGTLLPMFPFDDKTDFQCDTCKSISKSDEVVKILNEAELKASKKVNMDYVIEYLETFLEEYKKILHCQNYIMLSVTMKLGFAYGNMPPKSVLTKLTDNQLERKLELCNNGLKVLEILDNGSMSESGWKKRLLNERMKTKLRQQGLTMAM